MNKLLIKRIKECALWVDGKGPAPHWRTQKMLFDQGYIDYGPTGFAYGTSKMLEALGEQFDLVDTAVNEHEDALANHYGRKSFGVREIGL